MAKQPYDKAVANEDLERVEPLLRAVSGDEATIDLIVSLLDSDEGDAWLREQLERALHD